jgi:Rap1a immunity proteins
MLSSLRWISSVALLAAISPAAGQTSPKDDEIGIYTTGEMLTSHCRAFLQVVRPNRRTGSVKEGNEARLCYRFVTDVLYTISREGMSESRIAAARICLPNNLDANTAAEIVGRFADLHPEFRTESGYSLVRKALADAFPCPRA